LEEWRALSSYKQQTLNNYKQQAVDLLRSIETGDTNPLAYINPNKYVQHNLAVGDGLAGVTAL